MIFTVYGCPIAQPRQRHSLIKTKDGREFIHNYTPKNDPVQDWKYNVAMMAKQETDRLGLIEGPIQLRVTCFLPRPQKLNTKKYPPGQIPHTSRPDCDNLIKSIKDALKHIVYKDDSQIFYETIQKFYHELGGKPRAVISIEEIRP